MLSKILPANVAYAETDVDVPLDLAWPQEWSAVTRAVDERRRQYVTTRHCARRALSQLGLAPVAIPTAPDRSPVWPPGVIGSLTHCPGYRGAAVARRGTLVAVSGWPAPGPPSMFAAEPSPPSAPAPAPGPSQDHIDLALSAIGIDAEPARPGPRGLLDRIASASERAELAALAASCLGTPAPDGSATELPATHEPATDSPAPDGPAIPWDRVLFSAKESVFKAWQPLTHLGLEFSEAAVTLQIDGRFAVKILREVPADVRGLSWHGRWVIIDGLILTVVLVGTARSRHAVSRAGLPLT